MDNIFTQSAGRRDVHIENTLVKCTVSKFTRLIRSFSIIDSASVVLVKFEPPRGKTNVEVSEQVRHKPDCTVKEDS